MMDSFLLLHIRIVFCNNLTMPPHRITERRRGWIFALWGPLGGPDGPMGSWGVWPPASSGKPRVPGRSLSRRVICLAPLQHRQVPRLRSPEQTATPRV